MTAKEDSKPSIRDFAVRYEDGLRNATDKVKGVGAMINRCASVNPDVIGHHVYAKQMLRVMDDTLFDACNELDALLEAFAALQDAEPAPVGDEQEAAR